MRTWSIFPFGAGTPRALHYSGAEVKARRRPDFVNGDEAAVYDFAQELLAAHDVSDARYAAPPESSSWSACSATTRRCR